MAPSPLTFAINGAEIHLRAVDVGQYTWLCHRGRRIRDDSTFQADFDRHLRASGRTLKLCQFYAAARSLFGLGSPIYDDYKCSFSFQFLLGAHAEGETYHYTLEVYDYKAQVRWEFHRVFKPGDPLAHDRSSDLLAHGLSREQLNQIVQWLCGYIEGYFETFPIQHYPPFFRDVESICLVYGLKDGQFFERRLKSMEEHHAEVKRLAEEIPVVLDAIDELLETV